MIRIGRRMSPRWIVKRMVRAGMMGGLPQVFGGDQGEGGYAEEAEGFSTWLSGQRQPRLVLSLLPG